MEKIPGPLSIVTPDVPDWVTSSELVATISTESGAGGAEYSPVESMKPQIPDAPHPAPVTDQMTC
jgi:hypothetical protein